MGLKQNQAGGSTAVAPDPWWAPAFRKCRPFIRRHWVLLCALAVLVAVWRPALKYPFVLDDIPAVARNSHLRDGAGLGQALARETRMDEQAPSGVYRPITAAATVLNARLTGVVPSRLRMLNFVLLGIVSVLVFHVAQRFAVPRAGALFAAFVYAVHPLRIETVVTVTGRAELLMAALVLGGLLLFGKWLDSGFWPWAASAAVCGFLAPLAKETGFTLLPLLAVPVLVRPAGIAAAPRRRVIIGAVAVSLAAGAALALRWRVLGGLGLDVAAVPGDDNPLSRTESVAARILTPLWTMSLAWILEFFPLWLKVDYGYNSLPVVAAVSQWQVAASSAVFVVTFGVIILARRIPGVAAGALLFLLPMFFLSNGPVLLPVLFDEPLLTLPSAGWAVFVGGLGGWLAARLAVGEPLQLGQMRVTRGAAVNLALGAAVALFATRTAMRLPAWRSEESIWAQARHDAPAAARPIAREVTLALAELHAAPAVTADQVKAVDLKVQAGLAMAPDSTLLLRRKVEVLQLAVGQAKTDPDVRQALDAVAAAAKRHLEVEPDYAPSRLILAWGHEQLFDRGLDSQAILLAMEDYRAVVERHPEIRGAWVHLYRLLKRLRPAAEAEYLKSRYDAQFPEGPALADDNGTIPPPVRR